MVAEALSIGASVAALVRTLTGGKGPALSDKAVEALTQEIIALCMADASTGRSPTRVYERILERGLQVQIERRNVFARIVLSDIETITKQLTPVPPPAEGSVPPGAIL